MDLLKKTRIMHEKHHKSIVLVLNNVGEGTMVGTGFLIGQRSNKCFVMTCYHVIAQGQNICVRLAGSSVEYVAEIMYEHEDSDLAILKITVCVKQQLLEFRESSWDVGIEEDVFLAAYYHPEMMGGFTSVVCLDPTVMPGEICGPLAEMETNPQFTEVVHSCQSIGGCSGGPLIYDSGVVGVHCLSRTQTEYACSSETVNLVIKEWLGVDKNAIFTIKELFRLLLI